MKLKIYIKDFLKKILKKYVIFITLRKNLLNIPVYIISYNQLSYLRNTIGWLEKYGFRKIVIIDNNSDFDELLEYYKTINYKVIKMKKNYGHLVFLNNFRFIIRRNIGLFFLTDPDLMPVDECPLNFPDVFIKLLLIYDVSKVGFSLKIDDIPDSYYLKNEVIEWESQYYKNTETYDNISFNFANIDTTFALYLPKFMIASNKLYCGIRTNFPYQIKHLPWYKDKIDKELNYYLSTKRNDITNWNGDFNSEKIKNQINKKLSW